MNNFHRARSDFISGELLTSLLFITILTIYGLTYLNAMATTSLWNDELYTIANFSSKGFTTSITDYHVANNHIFFNVLNAITPFSDSYEPTRARFWSFLFVLSSLLVISIYYFGKKKYLEGSILLFSILANASILDLGLQARGYGFLFYCALSTSFLHAAYIQSDKTKYLILIGILAVLGTWTVPTYLFFAAPLMLVTFIYKRTAAVFLIGFSTAVVIVALHIPVFSEMLHQMGNYSDQWGKEYATISSVTKTYRKYLFTPVTRDWVIFLFLFITLVWPFIFGRKTTRKDKLVVLASQQMSISIILFFTVCLYLETPMIRTTSFMILPTLTLLVTMLSYVYRNRLTPKLRPFIYIPVSICLGYFVFGNINHFTFKPIENWKGVAEFIEFTLPVDMTIAASFRAHYLDMYLSDDYKIVEDISDLDFLQGSEAIVDGDFLKKDSERFNAADFSPIAAVIQIPQRRGGYQSVAFMPSSTGSYLQEIYIDGIQCACREMTDRNNDTRWTTGKSESNSVTDLSLQFKLEPNRKYKSFVMISRNGNLPMNYSVFALKGGIETKLDSDSIYSQGDQLIINLANHSLDALELVTHSQKSDRFFSIQEIWLYEYR